MGYIEKMLLRLASHTFYLFNSLSVTLRFGPK
ncbi:hypothetical protein GGR41_001018 [Paenalcaligenes hominis]|uniref:Uncharacterized protein n=1 Tax=Paenalcaligenes hominis TaxID=643674 RepID=A0ABX0WPN0_9BURK|nr:hypothetical protein [Paenalcaligenes hominis]